MLSSVWIRILYLVLNYVKQTAKTAIFAPYSNGHIQALSLDFVV